MRHLLTALHVALLIALLPSLATARTYPKREMRGAWIQCVNGQYLGKTPQQIRDMLSAQLDTLAAAHINAVFFQVRAECDALYPSAYEPWSRFLTGQQGLAPADGWDPLQWMIAQCHQRNMELHAWINPYRAKTKGTTQLSKRHVAIRYPKRTLNYGDLIILNPALPENRLYTLMVIEDILTRYDVDGLHIDDYFYPYPQSGLSLGDESYYRADTRGFNNIADWRRDNVNQLIKDIHRLVRRVKPWVKFGVSPFGIYRNDPTGRSTAYGSATHGLQNYDDLYADPILWQKEGWVDYLIPQIYWNPGNSAADYNVLCSWWNDNARNRPLYIGQDVERTTTGQVNYVQTKYDTASRLSHVSGHCQWYAEAFCRNPGNYRKWLQSTYFRYPALQPLMPFIAKDRPGKPRDLRITARGKHAVLTWQPTTTRKPLKQPTAYVVYAFPKGVRTDTDNPAYILDIVREPTLTLPRGLDGYTIVVTALNRLQNESKGAKIKL